MKNILNILIFLLLSTICLGQTFSKVEILVTSKDVYKGGIVFDSIKKFITNGDNNILIKTFSNKVYNFNRDSIWGYKKDSNFYRFKPNLGYIKVFESNKNIIIYGPRKASKYGHSYWFSKNLDSKILPLPISKSDFSMALIDFNTAYKNDTILRDSLLKEFKWYYQNEQGINKVEILVSSKDIYNRGIKFDTLKCFHIDYVKNNIFLKTHSNKEYYFKCDSIWGYKINSDIYRFTSNIRAIGHKSDSKIGVVIKLNKLDDIIIYKSYYYLFSKDLNSTTWTLNKFRIRQVYKDNIVFLEVLSKEFKWYQHYYMRDIKTGDLKILEIYKQLKNK